MTRIRVAESVLQKAGAFGLDEHDPKLAKLLKKMVLLSAIATENKFENRRRYGEFILTVRDNVLVDINTNTDDVICIHCLGTEITPDGEDCICYEE